MKKLVILFVSLMFVNFAYAAIYECSDGSELIDDQDEIALKSRTTINGLGIGLTYSDETPALNRYSANVVTDAQKFELSNETPSVEVELIDETITITITNLTSGTAKMTVDGSSQSVEEDSSETFGNFVVFLVETSGTYPGVSSLTGIVGREVVLISNEVPPKVVSVSGRDYLIDLFSASDTNAIVIVKKCSNQSAEILKVESTIINETNTTETNNETSDVNETNQTTESRGNSTLNETQNETKTIGESLVGEKFSFTEKYSNIIIYTITGIIAFMIIFLVIVFIVYMRKTRQKNISSEVQPST